MVKPIDDRQQITEREGKMPVRPEGSRFQKGMALRVLELLNRSEEPIRDILAEIKDGTDFEAVGIRLHDQGDFPYYQTSGFSAEFVAAERSLCSRDHHGELISDDNGTPHLDCMCGNIIRGRTDPKQPFFTEGGSFWSNCTTKMLATSTAKQRQARTRNYCNGVGFETVVLVPLRSGDEIVGLLQLNDHRTDMVSQEQVRFLEGLGESIGVALARRQAEEELRRFYLAVQSATDGIAVADLDDQIIHVNPALAALWEYSGREDLIGQSFAELWGDLPRSQKVKETLIKADSWSGRVSWDQDRGSQLHLLAKAAVIRSEEGARLGTMASFTDLTELNKLQARLVHSERLAVAGQLATSVAHQVNSPLQGIAMLLHSMEDQCRADADLHDNLRLLKEAFANIRETVGRLLDLNRPSQSGLQPSRINRIIRETTALMRTHLARAKIILNLRLASRLPKISISPSHFGQIILNLLNNAMESFEAEPAPHTEPRRITITTSRNDDELQVAITDNGPGISDADLHKVFDPFFTSKKRLGIGLGLANSHQKISEWGGTIVAENISPCGASFQISLPLDDSGEQ